MKCLSLQNELRYQSKTEVLLMQDILNKQKNLDSCSYKFSEIIRMNFFYTALEKQCFSKLHYKNFVLHAYCDEIYLKF